MSMITRAAVAGAALRWLNAHRSTYPTWTQAPWHKRSSCWLTAASRNAAKHVRRELPRR